MEWTTDEWITAQPESVVIDSFTGEEDLRFYPEGDGTFVDGKAVLITKAGETSLTRNDLHWKNIALEASFVPKTMPDTASLVWVLGKDSTTLDCLEFNYFPKTGEWQINKVVNRQWEVLSSGMTQPTPEESGVTIMVVADGDQVRAFLNDELIASTQVDRSEASTRNELVLRSKENTYTRVDIERIRSWNLSLVETASGEGSLSLSEMISKLTNGRLPDVQDDFSGDTLQEYWLDDEGVPAGTLQDGTLRVENRVGEPIYLMNYILQVDLRFGNLSGDENFDY